MRTASIVTFCLVLPMIACSSSNDGGEDQSTNDSSPSDVGSHSDSSSITDSGTSRDAPGDSVAKTDGGDSGSAADTASGGDTAKSDSGTVIDSGSATDSGVVTDTAVGDAGLPAGWLYTKTNKVYVSDGAGGGSVWVGRGVNMDDIFLCGYDNTLWMTDAESTLKTIAAGLISDWKPSFVRISLSMNSYPTVPSWLSSPAQYKTPMTNVIESMGATPGVYVLVTVRSDASMIGEDTASGDGEATGLPSSASTTPDSTKFPTGTDATYQALVDTFAHSSFVLFGLSNEPGGNTLSNTQIKNAMSHAVGVIRAEEDKLGVPHHIVSVQGNGWTSDISFYASAPLPYDNVVYEVHGYPPDASSYTYSGIPVIIGEYGSLSSSSAFYSDVESKQIPNLAWDFEPYSDCSPDLVSVTHSTTLTPTAWGDTVKSYLLAHAP